ncbi:PepSY domain-containing protein [Sphingomonas fennica]|uniref:Peptidase n=1 Tax=Edaphosphingomonas fennica TaxID=114404 RepID=A0A2T4HWV1_9SPHN|nr:PepSY domain-containing protein [Sphingomonas fennica]PTD20240.1 peptidase [Sphingomonas fennica]
MLRPILFLHRWLGVAVGLVMTIWCLSGFVMLYWDYPRLMPDEQIRGLAPLNLPAAALAHAGLPADMPLSAARVEMMAGRAVLRVTLAIDPGRPIAQMRAMPANIDLATGRPIDGLSEAEALAVGRSFGRHCGIGGDALAAVPTGMDQWTVQTFRRHQPMHRIDYAGGATAYVAASGEVVQQTSRAERFWGWLGAVPHWLYPTLLRQDGALWSQVVIWSAFTGCFLTVTGLWVGIARLRRNRRGRIASPYRGLWWWHHMAGLFFGLLTLSWVASGLLSMNPWGFLESEAGFAERERLAGPMRWGDVAAAIGRLPALPPGTVRLEAAPLGGRTYLAAVFADGRRIRLGDDGRPAPLARDELAAALANGPPVAALELMRGEDDYYYAHKYPVTLPVWRAVLGDAGRTRLYIDPATGRLIRAFDGNSRAFRWLMDGLHSLDLPALRLRPIRDIVVLPLLAAVTLVCATGTWMGFRAVGRDFRRVRNRRRRQRGARIIAIEGATP